MDSKTVLTGYSDAPEPTRLRQIALLVEDLARAEELLVRLAQPPLIPPPNK